MTTVLLTALYAKAGAQRLLTEGRLRYAFVITNPKSGIAQDKKSGTMSLFFWKDMIRQDIRIDNGYAYSKILNVATKKAIVLQKVNDYRYAIEMALPHAAARILPLGPSPFSTAPILDMATEGLLWKGPKGDTLTAICLQEWALAYPEVFGDLPYMKGIPAKYKLTMGDGFVTDFTLEQMDTAPPSPLLFQVPDGYKLIDQKEYDRLIQ